MIGIVGGGLAAAKLVEGYREAGGDEEITIWSQDPHGPYHRPPLSKRFLRGEAEAPDALAHPVDWYAEHGADLRLGEVIASLDDVDGGHGRDRHGRPAPRRYRARAFRTLDDSLALREAGRGRQTAVVVGGNFIGCEVTASLTQLGVGDADRARREAVRLVAGPPLSEALAALYREHGVDLRLGTSEIPAADLTVAGIGVVPNVELAKEAGLEVRSGIVVDDGSRPPGRASMRSATWLSSRPCLRTLAQIEHWSNAAYHGTTLGRILAGTDDRYDIVSAFFSEEFGRSFKYFGDAQGHDSTSLEGDFAEGSAVFRFSRGSGRPRRCARRARTRTRKRL